MEYYCIMVRTGEEESFKKNAMACLENDFPDVQFFFFQQIKEMFLDVQDFTDGRRRKCFWACSILLNLRE
ncbi:hypothetical protein [Treponema sp.]|uniref:hypothetical protein n=1 Tax=Treponema sp. TaxID=166 RepID=UPI003F0742D4